ncbi:pyridoxamine 5'-phosphate oxidase family protein [Namhaeicola litoreus]|uniref:Pyridoxamine 5'-phosphate oxidase family protein n=1 Tax=Namhaeicola litoreus TaxID=1052145 RepID=A0ABW3Y3Q2_9FLAO
MKLSSDIIACMKRSVLCWLATVSKDSMPNVSPKEIFCDYGEDHIIVANIASPQTVKNLRINQNVCLSFIDIFVQKGYQIKGNSEIVDRTNPEFEKMHIKLSKMTKGKFPITNIILIFATSTKQIVAPSYLFYPETTEQQQIDAAKKTYRFL